MCVCVPKLYVLTHTHTHTHTFMRTLSALHRDRPHIFVYIYIHIYNIHRLLESVRSPCAHVRRWSSLVAAQLWEGSDKTKERALFHQLPQAVGLLLCDAVPQVLAAAKKKNCLYIPTACEYVSSYCCCAFVLMLLLCVFSYCYICVLILLFMCPHTAMCVSSYCYMYVSRYFHTFVLILLHMCPHTAT